MRALTIAVAFTLMTAASPADTPVNPDSLILQDFAKRVADYQRLHNDLESKLPRLKTTGSQDTIAGHQHQLAEAIRNARASAKQGDIFTPQIGAEFHRLIGLAMQGKDAERIAASLRHSEPVQFQLKVNDSYPTAVPRQSTPPTLLINLPLLPSELEYRILGPTLILLDAKANLVVDLLPNVFR